MNQMPVNEEVELNGTGYAYCYRKTVAWLMRLQRYSFRIASLVPSKLADRK